MLFVLQFILGTLILYLTLSITYFLFFTGIYCIPLKKKKKALKDETHKFNIIVPAHNEELLIASLCDNLQKINYPSDKFSIYIVADNCTDNTIEICSEYPVKILVRDDLTLKGKGYALEWAFSQFDLKSCDAVLILDADTTVDSEILKELNMALNQGEQVIQCYIEVPNRAESWFTELIFLSRTINNLFYHFSKFKLGLSAYLMGSGMCFKSKILQEKKWTAFSLSEDWEYYAQLVSAGIRIGFSKNAIVKQQESRSLNQATSQRLRWASGRFYVVKQLGIKLFFQGLQKKNIMETDASLALIFPNMSLLVNLTILSFITLLFLPSSLIKLVFFLSCLYILGGISIILIGGIFIVGNYFDVIKAILISPVFLIWKLVIDFVSFTGIYKGKEWIRTKRHISDE